MNIMKRIVSSFVAGGYSALLPQRRTSGAEIDRSFSPSFHLVLVMVGEMWK